MEPLQKRLEPRSGEVHALLFLRITAWLKRGPVVVAGLGSDSQGTWPDQTCTVDHETHTEP